MTIYSDSGLDCETFHGGHPDDEDAARECQSCLGYGHFDDDGNPTEDERCRKCLDCGGTGRDLPIIDEKDRPS